MSIAVSALIRPSPALRRLHALACGAAMFAGAMLTPSLLQAAVLCGAAWAACRRPSQVKPARIDISGVGQVRLTVYQQEEVTQQFARQQAAGLAVRLMPGSTLWPALLLLRLRSEAGPVYWIAVLPDSVAPDERRRLAVALRASAARA